jgi:ribulose-phosphate 3-epimerase
MQQIIPAILPHNFEEIQEKCSRIEGLVTKVQIDICDGIFGREKTWIPIGSEEMPAGFSYEFDIMLEDWRKVTLQVLTMGAKSIVSHVDQFSDEDITALASMVAPHSAYLGIAVSNDKSLDFHADMIRKAKAIYPHVFIQVMGIRSIGEQGQLFDEEALARVKALKGQFGEILVQVDGGITTETAKRVVDAGAGNIVVGSYIFGRDDAGASLEEINNAINS